MAVHLPKSDDVGVDASRFFFAPILSPAIEERLEVGSAVRNDATNAAANQQPRRSPTLFPGTRAAVIAGGSAPARWTIAFQYALRLVLCDSTASVRFLCRLSHDRPVSEVILPGSGEEGIPVGSEHNWGHTEAAIDSALHRISFSYVSSLREVCEALVPLSSAAEFAVRRRLVVVVEDGLDEVSILPAVVRALEGVVGGGDVSGLGDPTHSGISVDGSHSVIGLDGSRRSGVIGGVTSGASGSSATLAMARLRVLAVLDALVSGPRVDDRVPEMGVDGFPKSLFPVSQYLYVTAASLLLPSTGAQQGSSVSLHANDDVPTLPYPLHLVGVLGEVTAAAPMSTLFGNGTQIGTERRTQTSDAPHFTVTFWRQPANSTLPLVTLTDATVDGTSVPPVGAGEVTRKRGHDGEGTRVAAAGGGGGGGGCDAAMSVVVPATDPSVAGSLLRCTFALGRDRVVVLGSEIHPASIGAASSADIHHVGTQQPPQSSRSFSPRGNVVRG